MKYILISGFIMCAGLIMHTGAEESDTYYKKSLELADAGEIEEAIQELQSGIQSGETDGRVYMTLGILAEKIGQDTLALEALLNARKIDPLLDSAVFALALLYEKLKLPHEAIEIWKEYIRLSKNRALIELAKKHIEFLEKQ